MANGIDNIDWTKAYYKCVSCDIPCASCVGAGPYHSPDSGLESLVGVEGDKFKCLTCDVAFKYLVEETQECYPACLSGMYTISEVEGDYRCGFCESPCSTCRKCYTTDMTDEERTILVDNG